MSLFLVQHGEAMPRELDQDRHLTTQGERDVRKIARFLSVTGILIDQIWHSGKTRALETARILNEELQPSEGIIQMGGLAPKDHIGEIVEKLPQTGKNLMIVGHLPFLDKLCSFLVSGKEDRHIAAFTNGCILCLERSGEHWQILFHVIPDLLE